MNIIDTARREYVLDGIVSTSTFCRLTNAGYDADEIIEQISQEESSNG